jgi:arylsulfatase A-like enzyme
VSLIDVAPTVLEAAGVNPLPDMNGRSWMELLGNGGPGSAGETSEPHVFFERERHANVRRGDLGYPARAIRTREFLYIRNFRPDRWPAGDPEMHESVGPYGDIDDGPTKQLILRERQSAEMASFFRLSCAKRPAEELYDLKKDPAQLRNVAEQPEYAAPKRGLSRQLAAWMKETGDPRATGDDDRWDEFPYYGEMKTRERGTTSGAKK